MSSENTVADRLLRDARRRTARAANPVEGRVAMIVGIVALALSPIIIAGWLGGAAAIGLGAAAVRRPNCARQARIALVLGFAALVVATFFATLTAPPH